MRIEDRDQPVQQDTGLLGLQSSEPPEAIENFLDEVNLQMGGRSQLDNCPLQPRAVLTAGLTGQQLNFATGHFPEGRAKRNIVSARLQISLYFVPIVSSSLKKLNGVRRRRRLGDQAPTPFWTRESNSTFCTNG